MKNQQDYLLDLLFYIGKIERFTADGKAAFYADDKTQDAGIRCFEVIGEVIKRLPPEALDAHPNIPWKKIKGFRDFLAHHYEEVTLDILWESVEELPLLRAAVESLLK